MNRFSLYIVIVTLLAFQPLSIAKADVVERNNLLTQILSLSEKPVSFFLIKMEEKKIMLMAKGVVIREWVVDELRFAGEPFSMQPFVLEKKSINLDDLRIHTNGQDEVISNTDADDADSPAKVVTATSGNKSGDMKKAKKYELPAMEIDDMPTDYALFLNGGITINVSSGSEGPGMLYSLKQYTYYPILALWASLNKDSFTKIDLFFRDMTEAQALFWAFTDGTACIILPPGSEDFQI